MSITIWSKNKNGANETFHIAAICHEGYVCNYPTAQMTNRSRVRPYARIGKEWLPLPMVLSEAGSLEVCGRCNNQLACLASQTDQNLITLNQKDLRAND